MIRSDTTISMPIADTYDPDTSVNLPSYSYQTLIRVSVSGDVVAANPSTGTSYSIGPQGKSHAGSCRLRTRVWFTGNPDLRTNCGDWQADSVVWVMKATGAGTAQMGIGFDQTNGCLDGHHCWPQSGGRSVSIQVADAKLLLTASLYAVKDTVNGTDISFTAGLDSTHKWGQSIPYRVISWTWEPEGGTPSSPCIGNTTALGCSVRLYGRGLMRVVVRINGVEKEEAVRIDALPCPTGDPILDSDSVRKAMKDMWDDSNPDSAWSKKVEKGLHVFRHPTTKKVRVKRINDPNANGCTINMFAGIAPSDSGYILEAVIHSHPNKPGDPLNGCSGVAGSGYLGGGGSGWKSGSTKGDWPAAKTLKQDNVRLYSMDYEGNVWWLNPDIPDAQKPNNPNRYPWKGGSCDWYVP